MRSRSELAETYEMWATENEHYAKRIVEGLSRFSQEVRSKQVERAMVLIHEAQAYRRDAANLRTTALTLDLRSRSNLAFQVPVY